MLFLIRTAFWLMIIVLLLPTDEQQRSEVYGTAQAAVNDVASFCDRNPETCARGKDAFGVFVQKAAVRRAHVDGSHQNKTGAGAAAMPRNRLAERRCRRCTARCSRLRQADALRHERLAGHAQSRKIAKRLGLGPDPAGT